MFQLLHWRFTAHSYRRPGNVLDPFLFSLMVNYIKPKYPDNNMLVKFADDMTVSTPVKTTGNTARNDRS